MHTFVFMIGDLSASEITMPDEERIELMIRVKEGKLSMHDAVERVFIKILISTSESYTGYSQLSRKMQFVAKSIEYYKDQYLCSPIIHKLIALRHILSCANYYW